MDKDSNEYKFNKAMLNEWSIAMNARLALINFGNNKNLSVSLVFKKLNKNTGYVKYFQRISKEELRDWHFSLTWSVVGIVQTGEVGSKKKTYVANTSWTRTAHNVTNKDLFQYEKALNSLTSLKSRPPVRSNFSKAEWKEMRDLLLEQTGVWKEESEIECVRKIEKKLLVDSVSGSGVKWVNKINAL